MKTEWRKVSQEEKTVNILFNKEHANLPAEVYISVGSEMRLTIPLTGILKAYI